MNVKDLLSFLKASDPTSEVIMSKDGEGNGYSPLHLIQEAHYSQDAKHPWDVEANNDPFKGSKKCVLLWPSN